MPAAGYSLDYISVGGFVGQGLRAKGEFPFKLAAAVLQSQRYLRARQAQVLLGTGGYVCAAPVVAAYLLGIPVALLALDAMPSRAVRSLSRLAKAVFSGFPEAGQYLPPRTNTIFTGNPIRPEIVEASKAEGQKEFGLEADRKTILVSGGSQGAHSLNLAFLQALDILAAQGSMEKIQAIFQTGARDHAAAAQRMASRRYLVRVLPYIEKMPLALAAADLVIGRSGSGVSEILARGLPSVLVPYPFAASRHQDFNAQSLKSAGAAWVIEDRDLSGERLARAIEDILGDRDRYLAMSRAARSLARPGAAREIAQRLKELVR